MANFIYVFDESGEMPEELPPSEHWSKITVPVTVYSLNVSLNVDNG